MPINQSHTCGPKILLNVSYILKVNKAPNTTIITFTALIKTVLIYHLCIKDDTLWQMWRCATQILVQEKTCYPAQGP